MKKTICFILMLLPFVVMSASSERLDSLLNELSLIKDKNQPADLNLKSILCNDIAVCYQGLDENNAARTYFLQSIYFTEKRIELENNWNAQNIYDLAFLYRNMAVFESTEGNAEESDSYMLKSERFYKRLSTMLSTEEYNGLMVQFYETNFVRAYHTRDFEKAAYYIRKAEEMLLGIEGSNPAHLFRLHGELLSLQGQYGEAEGYFIRALNLLDADTTKSEVQHHQFIHSLITAKYHAGKYRELISFLENRSPYRNEKEALEYALSPSSGDLTSFLSNLFILAYAKNKSYEQLGHKDDLSSSYQWQNFAFKLVEEQTLKSNADRLGSTITNPKNKVLGVLLTLLELKNIEEFESQSVYNSLRILDVYHSARLHLERISYDINSTLWEEQKELKNHLSFINLKLEEHVSDTADNPYRDSLRNLSYELSMKLQALNQYTKRDKVLDEFRVGRTEFSTLLSTYVDSMDKNILTFFYTGSRDSLLILGINSDTAFLLASPVGTHFSEEIKELYNLNSRLLFNQDEIDRQRELNEKFYGIIFKPVEPYLKGTDLLIYPVDEMSYVSYEALLDSDKQYLINRFSFHYTTSLYSIINPTKPENFSPQLTSFYPSNYGVDSLAFLFNARTEVNEISRMLNGRILSDELATKNRFLKIARSSGIVHLASHSILNFNQPYESYVLFDAETDSNNRLFAYEIFSQTFNSDLVILSSCNSAKGEIEEGIGVVSLSNALYFAGVPSTVSSLWSAQDKSSSEIMIDFYKKLYAGNTKSKSLQSAKIEYLKNADKIKSQPFFWANYVIYGADDALFEKPSSTSWKNYLIGSGLCIILAVVGWFYFKSLNRAEASAK